MHRHLHQHLLCFEGCTPEFTAPEITTGGSGCMHALVAYVTCYKHVIAVHQCGTPEFTAPEITTGGWLSAIRMALVVFWGSTIFVYCTQVGLQVGAARLSAVP